MAQRRSFYVALTAVTVCAVYVWFAFFQQSVPGTVLWQNCIYTYRDQPPIPLQSELIAELEQVSIGGKTFYAQREAASGLAAPLEIFFPAGDNRYHVFERKLGIDEQLVRKPNIYLYSDQPTAFGLRLTLDGVLTASDPVYTSAGWSGVAHSDGMINHTIPYLFYEFATKTAFSEEFGWCIKSSEFSEWCERELTLLGLNERERADFVEYWQRVLPDSSYISIYLQPRALVERVSKLHVSPAPDAVLRLFFYVVPGEQRSQIRPPQTLPFLRQGFTLVEWGVILANQASK